MRDRLRGQDKADQSIFWFCTAWHAGRDSELYQILRDVKYSAFLQDVTKHEWEHITYRKKLSTGDEAVALLPEIDHCFRQLAELYKERYGFYPVETPLQRVKLADVREADVLTHSNPRTFPCIEAGWPCRVILWRGKLHVACAEDKIHRYHHPLVADANGFVEGFLR
jgi:hypothetical protein